MMGYFILFFCLCTIAVFVYSWLQDHPPEEGERVYYIGDCEGVPGYADRGKPSGCVGSVIVCLVLLAVFFWLL